MRNRMTEDRTRSRVVADGMHLLVVIDHRQARVFRAVLRDAVPELVTPYSPDDGSGRHLHVVEGDASGKRKPERKSFYEAIARTLRDAQEVLVLGNGTGASSAMNQLFDELERFHPNLAQRVVGRIVVDEHHLTDRQLLAKAREFYLMRHSPTQDADQ
jgi:hypothetical protein